jgi:ribosomal protein S18 acetylase RimI-like enzyme
MKRFNHSEAGFATMNTQIDQFQQGDVHDFLSLAADEGWICDHWEFDFLLRSFAPGCLVARVDDAPVAFITAIKYDKSGWLGNLLVRSDMRSKGIGSMLMKKSLKVLMDAGARTVWLTASDAGKAIYERLGFVAIDTIKRWRGMGGGVDAPAPVPCSPVDIPALDQSGWGDMREVILSHLLGRGKVVSNYGGFLICQHSTGGMQVGPWGATGRAAAEELLDTALAEVGEATRVFLDVPLRNVDAVTLLHSRHFSIRGSTALMFLGEVPAYNPSRIYALASMGSMG